MHASSMYSPLVKERKKEEEDHPPSPLISPRLPPHLIWMRPISIHIAKSSSLDNPQAWKKSFDPQRFIRQEKAEILKCWIEDWRWEGLSAVWEAVALHVWDLQCRRVRWKRWWAMDGWGCSTFCRFPSREVPFAPITKAYHHPSIIQGSGSTRSKNVAKIVYFILITFTTALAIAARYWFAEAWPNTIKSWPGMEISKTRK